MKRKFLSVLLALSMALTLLPAAALADETDQVPADTPVVTQTEDNKEGDTTPVDTQTDADTNTGADTQVPGTDTSGDTGTGPVTTPTVKEITQENVKSNGLWLASGSYKLMEDITLYYMGGSTDDQEITLDLNGHDITQSDAPEAEKYALIYGDKDIKSLIITNSGSSGGKITSAGSNTTIEMSVASNTLTIGTGVTVHCPGEIDEDGDTNGFAIFLTKEAENVEVNLSGCTISGMNGITVNGNNTGDPQITLENVTVTTEGTGIYQSGCSTFYVNNSTITSGNVGIEVRAGSLNVSGGNVTGGNSASTVTANGSGTTTTNAGIAVAQHTTDKPISVNVSGTDVSGGTALFVSDPQKKQDGISGKDPEIAVVVSGGSTLTGTNSESKTAVNHSVGTIGIAILDSTIDGDVNKVTVDETTGTVMVTQPGVGEESPVTTIDCKNGDGTDIEDTAGEAVAIIGSSKLCTSLSNAISTAQSGDMITLLKDVTASATVVVASKKLTLNLNGHKLTAATLYTLRVDGNGDLTIIDNSTGTPGEINNTHDTASTIDVNNGGKLTLGGEGGNNFIVENAQNKTIKENSAIKVEEQGTLTINGGTIRGPKTSEGNRRSVQTFGTTTINDGTFEGEVQVWTWKDGATTYPSKTTINGGSFKDTVAICNPAAASESFPFTGTLEVKGGTFTNENEHQEGYHFGVQIPREGAEPADDMKVEVSGGAFSAPVDSDYLAASLKYQVQAPDGKAPYSYYPTVTEAAAAAAENGGTVTNIEGETPTVVYVIAFDLNGASGTVAPAYVENNEITNWPADPTRNGYTFSGWYTESSGGTQMTATSEFTRNITLYARWTSTGGGGSSGGGGGGSGSNISVSSSINGKVTSSPKNPKQGDKVTLTIAPNTGYELTSLTVKDNRNKKVTVTKVSDTEYTFTMPSGRVTITPVFSKIQEKPPVEDNKTFIDVPANAYYAEAVKWAVDNGITTGTGNNTFSPNASCTRAQTVTFLWRAAGSPAPKSSANPFTDVKSGAYYYDAVLWAVEQGITKGTSADTFSPEATVTRAQTVTFLYRAAGSPVVSGSSSFSDVAANAYYAGAVKWAVDKGVTTGTGNNSFSPNDNCIRGQIVTFLYRDRVG